MVSRKFINADGVDRGRLDAEADCRRENFRRKAAGLHCVRGHDHDRHNADAAAWAERAASAYPPASLPLALTTPMLSFFPSDWRIT